MKRASMTAAKEKALSYQDKKKELTQEVSYDLGDLTIRGLCVEAKENNAEEPTKPSNAVEDNIVLCLHGWLDNAASFQPLLPHLAKALPRKNIIAIDWFGHGLSSHRSADAHYHFIDWVYDLVQLFELNQWQQVDIVAHSMGGMIASAFAAAFPEKVKSLTLIDSIGLLSAKAQESTTQLRRGMLSRLKDQRFDKNKPVKKQSRHLSEDSAIKARVNVSDLTYEHAKLIVQRGLLYEDDGYVWRSDHRLRKTSPYRLTLAQAEQFIQDIKCPVQLIYGNSGMDMVAKGLKHFGPLFTKFKAVELEGGHHVHMEKPSELAALIKNEIIT
jgi:pimeloyl-ACP methyl ester carboxylesterase